MNSLQVIYSWNKKESDKGTRHRYIEFYGGLLWHKRHSPVNLLEIGIAQGGSLKMWSEYFTHQDTKIIGVDIVKCPVKFEDKRVTIIQKDATVPFDGLPGLDFVIDDASHKLAHQAASFKWLYPLLKQNGAYSIEDIQDSFAHAELMKLHDFETYEFGQVFDDIIMLGRKN